jgi:heme/copper-type cytochrome/quinol oxidase subunit 2
MISQFSVPPLLLTVQATVDANAVPSSVLDVLFWTAAVACAIAQYFIVRAVWKVIPSGISSPDVPAPRRALEIMWVLLPVLLLAGAFAGTWRHLHPASSGSSPDAAATRA